MPSTRGCPSPWNCHVSHQDTPFLDQTQLCWSPPDQHPACVRLSASAQQPTLLSLALFLPASPPALQRQPPPWGRSCKQPQGGLGSPACSWPSARPCSPWPGGPRLVPQPYVTGAEQSCYFCPWSQCKRCRMGSRSGLHLPPHLPPMGLGLCSAPLSVSGAARGQTANFRASRRIRFLDPPSQGGRSHSTMQEQVRTHRARGLLGAGWGPSSPAFLVALNVSLVSHVGLG